MTRLAWRYDDGGRAAAGLRGATGDCVVRALAIVTYVPYLDVYRLVAERVAGTRVTRPGPLHGAVRGRTVRVGVPHAVTHELFADLDWAWTPIRPTRLHVAAVVPDGLHVLSLTGHVAAVVDRVIHDTFNPLTDGRRRLDGYWSPPEDDR